ncbi:MAG: polyphosphate polymerase domain-containing protein [Kiritimatiellae bacterium]|nr:polyphosphate polymerase domain-containing protein [Kiritimatiellia bacterium]
MRNGAADDRQRAEEQSEFERYEAKYLVDRELIPGIREFIRPFCVPDPNASGDPPEYVITTLQMDGPTLALHRAKENEAITRFKLRCRTYGVDNAAPVFLEIKRKIKGVVLKSRVMIPRDCWGASLFEPGREVPFRSRHERLNFAEFLRLKDLTGAGPVAFIRYTRESYLGRYDDYARLTFDRRLCYRPARSWDFPPPDAKWRMMDSGMAQERNRSCLVMELKTYRDAPQWMVELTERFDLVRAGTCKYSTAMNLELLFQGSMYADPSEDFNWAVMGLP